MKSAEFMALAYNDDADSIVLLDAWAKAQDNIVQVSFQGSGGKSFKDSLKFLRARVRFLTDKKPGVISGVSTGFANADRFTSGWQPGDLIILAGDTGMGKTAVALECALVNIKQGVPVVLLVAK